MADRDSIAATATVAAVLALGLGFFVLNRDDDSTTTAPTSGRSGLAPCGAGDLVVAGVEHDRAGHTAYLTATLRLARRVEPCTVRGRPGVILLAGGVPAGVATVADASLGTVQRLTVLPDRSARVTLAWTPRRYCGPVANDAVRLWVAPDLPLETEGFGRSAACAAGVVRRPPVRVGAFTYVDPRAERGSVTGVVTLNDGPEPGTGEYVHSGEVQFVGPADTFRAAIGRTGSYDVELPSGTYEVRVSTHQWHAGETYVAGPLDVTGGELTVRNVPMPVR